MAGRRGRVQGRGGPESLPPLRPSASSLLRTAFLLLGLISATWLLGLLAVNSDSLAFHYLFAVFSGLQVGSCPSWGRPW